MPFSEVKSISLIFSQESDEGLVSIIYNMLAVRKQQDGSDVFVYLDRHCLNYGQNWQDGFMNGLKFSQAVILLISNQVLCRTKIS